MPRAPAQPPNTAKLPARVAIRSPPMTTAANAHPTQASADLRYTVTRADLPLSCPLPSMALWNSHPRVYLPIEAERECLCPYCGSHFTLVDD